MKKIPHVIFHLLIAFSLISSAGAQSVTSCLTNDVDGYASLSGEGLTTTTGGVGGAEVTLSTLAELEAWVLFREDNSTPQIIYINGLIEQPGATSVVLTVKRGGNITIIGNTADAGLKNIGLNFRQYTNVIVRNLTVREVFYPNDGITIDECHHVWIDHCDLYSKNGPGIGIDTYDGLLDIKNGSHNVTVSWNRLHSHKKVNLIGHTDNVNAQPVDVNIRVTFHHNYYYDNDGRNPSLRWGAAHLYNNFYKDIYDYGIALRQGAHALVENNIYENVVMPITTNNFTGEGIVCERGNVFTACGPNSITQTDCNWWNPTTLPYAYSLTPTDQLISLLTTKTGTCALVNTPQNQPPTVQFSTTSGNPVCAGTAITFNADPADADGSISKVDFYDGSTLLGTINALPFTYIFTNPSAGTHTFKVKATDDGGLTTTSAAISLTVNSLPSAPAVTTPVTYCENAAATALTSTGTSLKWYTSSSGGTGSSTAPTPSTGAAGTTNYYVSQTLNGCESARALIAVTVNAPPSAPAVTTPVSYCQNAASVALAATGTSFKWYTSSSGGTGSSTAPIPSTSAAGSINHYVSQTVSGCESSRAEIIVNIDEAPSAANAGLNQAVVNAFTTLSANVPAVGTGMWSVINGSGSFSDPSDAATPVSGLSSGINTFQWTISNGVCSTSSDQVIIKVGAAPVTQTIDGPDSVGYGTNGVIYSILDFAGSTYSWTITGDASVVNGAATSGMTVNVGSSGSVLTVSVTETNSFGSANSSKNVAVGPAPIISSVSGPAIVISGETHTYSVPVDANPNTVFTWTVPAGSTIVSGQGSNVVTIYFPAVTSGNVNVTASNGFGSGSSSIPVTVNAATGLWGQNNTLGSASAYPNPFSDEISLMINAPLTEKIHLKVINMRGEVIFESDAWSSNEKILLGQDLPEGIFIIQAMSQGKVLTTKVVKLK
jgi:pectate lyase